MKTLYYNSLVRLHLYYGCLLRGNTPKTHTQRLEVLQRKAIRAITKSKYNSAPWPLFKKTNILKLSYIYNKQISIFMYDYTSSNIPTSIYHKYSPPTTTSSDPRPDIIKISAWTQTFWDCSTNVYFLVSIYLATL